MGLAKKKNRGYICDVKTKTKAKAPAKTKKAAARTAEGAEAKEETKTTQQLQAVLDEVTASPEHEHLEEDASIECPYCGEFFDVHVTAENDGQTIYETCDMCSRSVSVHVELQDGEFNVDAHRG